MTARYLHDILDGAADFVPSNDAVVHDGVSWTYSQLQSLSQTYAAWLMQRGVVRGDRVLVLSRNEKEAVALIYATSRLGAVYVVLSQDIRSFHLEHILKDSAPALVVCSREVVRDVSMLASGKVHAWDELPTIDDYGVCPRIDGASTDLVSLIYTSGTTAMPKAVASTHAQVLFASTAISERLEYRPTDRVFCCLPLSFDYGLYQVFLSALAGACLVLGDSSHAGPKLLSALETEKISVLPAVPGLAQTLSRLARRAGRMPPRLRLITNTGAALPPAVSGALRSLSPNLNVVGMYGLTECKRVSIETPNSDLDRPGSVGLPLTGTEVLILDEDHRALPRGHTGQIAVRGPNVMAGYWNAPDLTEKKFLRDDLGCTTLLTGDIGRLDEHGRLYFVGRHDDIYKQDGFRVSSVEIEGAAMHVEGIDEVAVLKPNDVREATLVYTGDLDVDEVRRELMKRIEGQKIPKKIYRRGPLPHGVNGKIDKQVLEDQLS
ncbi:class I adenylate-forming enzyme family protein [Arthrobacter sp. E44]|uniref:class I adenylate-forming enzyme family protein n=1 Tax=Arthrobacter sp. E44 TaxID=3341794 RepID=UPI0035A60162